MAKMTAQSEVVIIKGSKSHLFFLINADNFIHFSSLAFQSNIINAYIEKMF